MQMQDRQEQLNNLRLDLIQLDARVLQTRYEFREFTKGRYEMLSNDYRQILDAPRDEMKLYLFHALLVEEAQLKADFQRRKIAALEYIIEQEALEYV